MTTSNTADRSLATVAPGTYAFATSTGGSEDLDYFQATSELLRAKAILNAFIDSLPDSRADDRFVLWSVDAILKDALAIIEASP